MFLFFLTPLEFSKGGQSSKELNTQIFPITNGLWLAGVKSFFLLAGEIKKSSLNIKQKNMPSSQANW
jgi:hypothetical protein